MTDGVRESKRCFASKIRNNRELAHIPVIMFLVLERRTRSVFLNIAGGYFRQDSANERISHSRALLNMRIPKVLCIQKVDYGNTAKKTVAASAHDPCNYEELAAVEVYLPILPLEWQMNNSLHRG